MTADDLDILEQGLKQFAPELLTEDAGGLISRSGQQVGNLPSNVLESFVRTGQAIGNLGLVQSEQSAPAEIPKPFDIPEAHGLGESAVDILLGQLAPELAAALVPYAGVSKLGRAAGLGRLGSEIVGQAAAGGFTGIKSGPEEALKQGLVGGALGGISMLPHAQRLLPLAGLAAADYATQPDTESGLLAGGLDVAFGLLPGSLDALRARRVAPEGILNNIPAPRDRRAPRLEYPEATTAIAPEFSGRPQLPAPEGRRPISSQAGIIDLNPEVIAPEWQTRLGLPGLREGAVYPFEQELPVLQNQFREGEKLVSGRVITPGSPTNVPSLSDIYTGPKALRPSETFGRDFIEVPELPTQTRSPIQQSFHELSQLPVARPPEGGMHQDIVDIPRPEYPNPTRSRGKLRGEPEYRRTEGGSVAFPLLSGFGGATVGGALPAEDEQERINHILAGGLVGLTGGHALSQRTNRIGAINLGQPFRTSFEREAVAGPEGRVVKIGTRDIGKSGLIDLKGFKKAANISEGELKAYQMHYPDAFVGQTVDLQKLHSAMSERPLLKITDLPHKESMASAYDKALADLQHTVDNTRGAELQGEPGNHRLRIHDAADNLLLDVDFEINYDMLSKAGIENPTDFDQLTVAWNNFVNSDWIPDDDSARAASVRYDLYGLNPRPLEELQKKEGFDQIIQIPGTPEKDSLGNAIAGSGVFYIEPHFNNPDDINTLSHTRNYIDEVPGKGRTLISYENQSQWQQSLRGYNERYPEIKSIDKLPKGWSWKWADRKDTGEWVFDEDIEGGGNFKVLVDDTGKVRQYDVGTDDEQEILAAYNKEVRDDAPAKDHPMVDDATKLSAKGLIDRALKDPTIKGIFSTDGETVVITEKHDEVAKRIQKVTPSEDMYVAMVKNPDDHFPHDWYDLRRKGRTIRPLESANVEDTFTAPKAEGIFAKVQRGIGRTETIIRVDDPKQNGNLETQNIAKELHATYDGGKTLPEEGTFHIPQLEGMKEHYDRRLKNVFQELTGSTPERISLGEGSHKAYSGTSNYRWGVRTFDKEGELAWESERGMHYFKTKEEAQKALDEELYFPIQGSKTGHVYDRGPQGSPALGGKSDISGWWFSLDKLRRSLKGSEARLELGGATKFPEHPIRAQVGQDVAETLKEVKKGEGIIRNIPEDVKDSDFDPVAPRITSTALMHEGKPLRGPEPSSSHQQIMHHNPEILLADTPPDLNKQGGFMVKMPDGTEKFVTRDEATAIGIESGQVPKTTKGPLHSQIVDWKKGTGGFASTHALTTIAGATVGAEEGYRQSGGDLGAALAGAFIGGAGGYVGYKVLEGLTRVNPKARTQPIKEAKSAATELMNRSVKDIAGEEVRGRGGIMSKWIRGLEHWGRLSLPETVKTAWTQARGKGVLAVSAVQQAFKALKQFDPTPEVREAASKFIEGKLLGDEALRIIRSNGGIEPSAWEATAADSRPKGWGVWNVDLPSGETIPFRVSPDLKAKLIAEEEKAFTKALGTEHETYGKFVTTARRAVDELQSIFASGMPEGQLRRIIQNSTGQYVTRTYKIFTDPDYRPTDAQIEASAKELAAFKDANKIEYTDDTLRIEIEQYLHDVRTNRALFGEGLGLSGKTRLDTTLFKEREDLTPTFRELLGEYTDPKEKLIQAISRLYPSAQASHFINLAKGIELDGFRAAMPEHEWVKLMASTTDPAKKAALEAMTEVPKSLKFGALKGMKVNRFVADQLMEIDGPLGMAAHPIMRGINNWSKIIHTAYDPLRHVRNIVTTPMFLWFGKASLESVDQAVRVLSKKDGQLYREMIENGVLTADQVASEFRGTAQSLFNGHYDSSLTKKFKAFHNGLLELYRYPDLAVRAATYIEAKSRIGAKLGKAIDDPDVIKAAVQWTDERTMNYDNIAPAVRLARQLPFFNLYISYTAEIARIMKNISKDALKGDVQSMLQLGAVAGAFEAAQAISVASLSAKDQKDWATANAQGPAYSRSRYKFVTSRDAKGNFHYTDFTPLIPTDNFNQMFRSIAKGDWEAVRAVNPFVGFQETPILKIGAEQVTGKDIFTDRPFRDSGDRLMSVVQELSPTLTPGVGYEWKKFATIGQENTKTGRKETWGGMIQKYLTGLAPTSVNPSVTQRNATAEAKRHIANERAYLTDVLKMKGVSPEARERAIKKYQQAVSTILETYRSKSNL